MAIAYDSNGSGLGSSAASNFSFSFTVGSGSNRILFVSAGHSSVTEQVAAITYAGASLTKIGYISNGSNIAIALWYLINPATGANSLAFTALGGTTVFVGASSYSGASQSGQPDATTTDGTHAASAGADVAFTTAVTTVTDQDWLIAATIGPACATGAASDCTIVSDQSSHSIMMYHKGPVTPAGSNSITIDTNFSGGTVGPTVLAAFSPAAAAVAVVANAASPAALRSTSFRFTQVIG